MFICRGSSSLQVAFGRGEHDRAAAFFLRGLDGDVVEDLDLSALAGLELDRQLQLANLAGVGAECCQLVQSLGEIVVERAEAKRDECVGEGAGSSHFGFSLLRC